MSTGIEALRQQARDMGTASDGTFMTMRTGDVRAAIAAHDDALAALAGALAAQQELERQAVAAGEQLSEAQARLAEIQAQKPVAVFKGAHDGRFVIDFLHGYIPPVCLALYSGPVAPAAQSRLAARHEPVVTDAMVSAALCSQARDDEGEFPVMLDLLDFSGENKSRTAMRHALECALLYAPETRRTAVKESLTTAAPVAPAAQQPHRLKETSVVQPNNSAGPLSTQADTRAAAVERAAELAGRVAGEETANTIRHAGIVIGTNNECPTCKRY